jgi:hypothetical protein
VLRAVAATARPDSAGRFSDELDDTNYLSSDDSLQGYWYYWYSVVMP